MESDFISYTTDANWIHELYIYFALLLNELQELLYSQQLYSTISSNF